MSPTLDFTDHSKETFESLAAKSETLRQLFGRFSLDVTSNMSLRQYFLDVEILRDFQADNSKQPPKFSNLLGALQLQWIAEAVLSGEVPLGYGNKLRELLDGDLNLLKRRRTRAKDALWEFEVRNILARGNIACHFDEPDLVITERIPSVGVACKKIYSEANVSKTVSTGVGQIKNRHGAGVVALNIDDLLPEDKILKVKNTDRAIEILRDFSTEFIARHEHTFRKYLQDGRCIFIMASAGSLADIEESNPRFNGVRQSVSWNIPGMNTEHAAFVMDAFQHGRA